MTSTLPSFDTERYERLFDEVWNQLHRLQTVWTIYFCLTGTSQTVELLRSTAWVTFGALQELMIEAMYLRTHRLLEEATPRGRRRASLETLIQRLPASAAHLKRQLKRDLATARRDCGPLTEWRDRYVAHRDEATALREHPSPLPPVQASIVGRTIEFAASALTAISAECNLGRPYRVHHEMADSDVHKLIDRLRRNP